MPTRGQKWRDLHAELLRGIQVGTYPVGTAMPSIPELISAGKGSDSTIKRAYQELREAGLIESRRGSGTWVLRQHPASGPDLADVERRVVRIERHLGLDHGDTSTQGGSTGGRAENT